MSIQQKFQDDGRHCLVNTDTGVATQWMPYQAITFLDGYVGVTDYYTGTGEQTMTPEQFVMLIAGKSL